MQNIELNENFNLAYKFVTETNENIFLTGKAGTGKTTFLKYLKDNATKNMVVAAPTGVAAINAGGVTLHSLFQLPFHPFLPTKNNKDELLAKLRHNKNRQQLLQKMELLIIDEISMVRCDTMDAIDTVLRSVRRNYNQPFGGVQLLCIGDLHQLQPVAKNEEWKMLGEYYASPFFFDSLAVKEQMPLLIELNKIYRQKEQSFVNLLNKVRTNTMDVDDFEDLHLRYIPSFSPSADEKFITLTTHNNQADLINQQKLVHLTTPLFTFNAIIEDEFPEHIYPVEASLVLKEGAQVMFLKNDTSQAKQYFNGKIGVIKNLTQEKIIVDCDGVEIFVGRELWENTRYTVNKADGKLEQEVVGTFEQYPLRLAWAITIHKSQGLTFEKVMIDAGAAFSSGQVYVALSRCTSLEGIVLLSKIPPSAITSNESVEKGQKALTPKGLLAERFAGARQIFTQQLVENIFSFEDIEAAINVLAFHINQQQQKLTLTTAVDGGNTAVGWVENIKQNIANDKAIGLKFSSLVAQLMKDEGIVEKNTHLQKRITDAANHFIPKLDGYFNHIKNHPLSTEHKETSAAIDEKLNEVGLHLYTTNYYLQYCKNAFSITEFLKYKLKYSIPKFKFTCYAVNKTGVPITDTSNTELYSTLRRWRDALVLEENVPVYLIANHESLKEISTYLPLTKKDLLQISGFGKAKVDKYGDEILGAVEEYCERNGLETNMAAKAANPKKEKKPKANNAKPDTKFVSFTLHKEGKTIEEIAKERNFTTATIEGHLAHYISLGELNVNDFVTPQRQQQIKDAVAIHGNQNLTLLIQNLPTGFSYGEVRMVVAAEKVVTPN
jgi:hypothetical protein